MEPTQLLRCAQRLQAIAQAGLAYPSSAYDVERYEEVRLLSAQILQELTEEPLEKILRVFASETGYQTPKVDVRAVVFRGTDEVLMVQEKVDENRWTLPGGWADIGCSPYENAVKETWEEAGLRVAPVRLLALWDKKFHPHPPQPWYVYKIFVECAAVGGELLAETTETAGARWVRREELAGLPLSTDRVTLPQLESLFGFAGDPGRRALCD